MPVDSSLFHKRERLTLGESCARSITDLAAQLQYVANHSPFYRTKWGEDVTTEISNPLIDDPTTILKKLPFTEKDELRRAQDRCPPYGDYLACDPSEVVRVHRTSGTTGRPLIIALTGRDAARVVSHGAQSMWCAGLRPTDIVVHCLNYSMWSGGVTDHMCLEGTGAAVIPFGVGNTSTLLGLPAWVPFTAVSCTPSYVSLLLEHLDDGEGRQRWSDCVRLFLVGGEPGGSDPQLRDAVARLDAAVVNANYGLSEILSIFGSECPVTGSLHFHGQGTIWPEVIDPQTSQPIEIVPGAFGELILSHIRREAQPLVRYRTGDLIEIASTERCECGRGGFSFKVRGRSDEMFIVRGVNVFPSAIAAILGQISPRLREYVVILPDVPPYDAIPLQVEAPANTTDMDTLASRVADAIKEGLGCSASVTVVPPGSLPRTEGKARRIVRAEDRSR